MPASAPNVLPDIKNLQYMNSQTQKKTYACDMIWKVDPYPRSPRKRYQSTYKTTYTNKIIPALQYNRDVLNQTYNMRKTSLSVYINAVQQNKMLGNTDFRSG